MGRVLEILIESRANLPDDVQSAKAYIPSKIRDERIKASSRRVSFLTKTNHLQVRLVAHPGRVAHV